VYNGFVKSLEPPNTREGLKAPTLTPIEKFLNWLVPVKGAWANVAPEVNNVIPPRINVLIKLVRIVNFVFDQKIVYKCLI